MHAVACVNSQAVNSVLVFLWTSTRAPAHVTRSAICLICILSGGSRQVEKGGKPIRVPENVD